MNETRAALLVAARAARRWPLGRPTKAWFIEEALEGLTYARSVPLATARRAGDPAVCVAALRAYLVGQDQVSWREIFVAQEQLVELLGAQGIEDYNRVLSRDPLAVAVILERLAGEMAGATR